MEQRFKTKAEAIQAGYREVNRGRDRDISGGNYFGYQFQDSNGNKSVTVWFTEETNQIGQKGSFAPMYPPKK